MNRLLGVVLVIVSAGCETSKTTDGGHDAGHDAGGLPPCDCAVDGNGALTLSWDCYVTMHGGALGTPQAACNATSEVACGLRTDTYSTPGGASIQVYENGVQVGAQDVSDTTHFTCPDNAAMTALTLRAGRFPDAACARTACDCVDGGVSCDVAPCNCEVVNGVLTMSWACYCGPAGCQQQPPMECAGYRHSTVACGLRSDTILTAGGALISVFDADGTMVGAQSGSDQAEYVCPDNPQLHSVTRRGGIFPDAGCASVDCDCIDGGVACP